MAHDEEETEGGGKEAGGGGSKKKLFIIIGAVLFLLIGGLGGAYFMGLFDSLLGPKAETAETPEAPSAGDAKPEKSESAEKSDKADKGDKGDKGEAAGPTGPVAFFDIPEMTVSLNSSQKKTAFLKMQITLEVAQATEIPKVQNVMPRVVDNLQEYLRELRVEDLKGSAGADRLKREMLIRVKTAAYPAKVNTVLIKSLQVQ